MDGRAVGREAIRLDTVCQERGLVIRLVADRGRHRERADLPGHVGRAADDGAVEDGVQAVLVGEDDDPVERVRRAPDRGVAGENEGRHDLVRPRVGGVRDDVRDGRENVQRSRREGRIRARVDVAPGAVRDCGQAVLGLADQLSLGADAPEHRVGPGRILVEGVELALVGHVRPRPEDLAEGRVGRVLDPDGVCGRTGHGRPAQQAGIARVERSRHHGPAHVEPERRAPRAGAVCGQRAHVRVERVRLAADPRERDRDRNGRRLQAGGGPDDRVVGERLAGGELDLVATSPPDRVPGERGCPREGVDDGLVDAKQEAVHLLRGERRGRRRHARAGRAAQRKRGKNRSNTEDAGHRRESFRQADAAWPPSNG